jgi:sugar (pentulose or hexulose) kinase
VGIDIGTTVVKTIAFDDEGRIVASTRRPNTFRITHSGWSECDMDHLWSTVCETLSELTGLLARSGASIRALGISGYMGGAWLIDSRRQPVRAGILWNDGRAADLLDDWKREGIVGKLFDISCNAPLPGFSVPLLRWLHDNEIQAIERAKHLLFAKDWIRFRLTGELSAEESDAIHLPADANQRSYSTEVFRLAEIDELVDLLPPLLGSGDIAGRVNRAASERTGIPMGIPVVSGLADVSACLTGAGAIHPGQACSIVGTSCLNNVSTAAPVFLPAELGFCFLLPNGIWARCMPNTTGTLAFEWFKREFVDPLAAHEQWNDARLDQIAAEVPPGARGLFFHPYLNTTGVLAPVFAPKARARFSGLSVEHTRFDMLRAIYEGVAFAMADCMEHLPASEDPIRLVGGAARSWVWSQIFADVSGRPMVLVEGQETGALGVAMLAGIATGIWNNLEEAVVCCCKLGRVIEPHQQLHEFYSDRLQCYKQLRSDLVAET